MVLFKNFYLIKITSFYKKNLCFFSRYHTGSLAFGAFLIALVQLIRIFLEYMNHKLKKSESKAAKFIMTCLRCCFWCLEKVLKFINRNAYIMVGFFLSARCRKRLILENIHVWFQINTTCNKNKSLNYYL